MHLLLNDLSEAHLADTLSKIKAIGGKAHPFCFDVSSWEAWQVNAKVMLAQFEAVDMVINNAGVALYKCSLNDISIEDMEWVMKINFWGTVYGTKAFLPHLLTRPAAWVVNLSSVFGLIGVAEQGPYCTSKFAVRGFTESLRMELLDTPVTVLGVHPGGISTAIARNSRHYDAVSHEETVKQFEEILAKTTPTQAAQAIVRAIRCRETKLLIGNDARLIDTAARLIPRFYTRLVRNFMQKQGVI